MQAKRHGPARTREIEERERKRQKLWDTSANNETTSLLFRLPNEILIEIFLRVRPIKDIVSASLTCRLLYDTLKDKRLWKTLFFRMSSGRPPVTRHHKHHGKSWKWLAITESLEREWPREARLRGVAAYIDKDEDASPFHHYWYVGDCISDGEDDYGQRKTALHGYGFTHTYSQDTSSTPLLLSEGLWWKGDLCESSEEMPEDERVRADLNRPFDPAVNIDGTGYAMIDWVVTFGCYNTFYKGEWRNGKPHGYGRSNFSTVNNFYEGEWRNGRHHGKGRKVYGDGTEYEGTFFDGVQEGTNGKIKRVDWSRTNPVEARVHFEDGRVYQGKIKNGDLTRNRKKGRMEYPDGSVYTGAFFRGQRHGPKGTLYFKSPDWRRYTGFFVYDLFQGINAKLKFSDGSRVTGHWDCGVFDVTKKHKIKHRKGPIEPPHACAACNFVKGHRAPSS
jgi:hypothetical protein